MQGIIIIANNSLDLAIEKDFVSGDDDSVKACKVLLA